MLIGNKATPLFCSILVILISLKYPAESQAQSKIAVSAIRKETITYSTRDTDILKMDIYHPEKPVKSGKNPCVLFVFGGGFYTGSRDYKSYTTYFNTLAREGYTVASIDYRLGLKGGKKVSVLKTKPLKDAIAMAVTDVYDATNYIIMHAATLGIDTGTIVLSGSSAGAITSLQADWEKRNATHIGSALPQNFQYKGVIAFAGAILSYKGAPGYAIPPAPTMFFHGSEDKVVVYNKRRLFNKGFFGSNYLACRFRKKGYPYYYRRVYGRGHEIAGLPMHENLNDITWFLDKFVIHHKPWQIEYNYKDMQAKPTFKR